VSHSQNLFGFDPARFFTFLLNATTKTDFIARVVAFEFPRVTVFQPVVWRLFLATVNDVMLKHTVIITDTVTTPRQPSRRQRIDEASRQTSQTTVTEARVIFFINQLFEI